MQVTYKNHEHFAFSAQAEFKTLGVRQDWHYSETEKEELFIKAVGQMKNFIEQYPDKPASIPELVRRIFDDSLKVQELEDIRELLRPTNRLARHEISASGHKLLALLAIQQDQHCLDKDGKLRIEYTKSVMRGWFGNGADIHFDDSALQNIRRENQSGDINSDVIRLGKNRLSEIKLENKKEIASSLQKNYEEAEFGEKSMNVDFNSIPQRTVNTNFNEIALGDMNGNSIMFLHQLVQSGLADIKQGKESDWKELIESIRKGKVDGFREKLADLLECKNTDKKLVLLGDLLSDRTYNDWFTLSIIDFLHEQGQNFSICFSNHDAAFVEFYLNYRKSGETHPEKTTMEHTVSPSNSLDALQETLGKNPALGKAFHEMVSKYFSHLTLFDSSLDQRQMYSHGIVTEEMLKDMLLISGETQENIDEMSLHEKIKTANKYFQEIGLSNLETFRALMKPKGSSNDDSPNPFNAAIWSIGPFSENRLFNRDKTHPYLNPQPPFGAVNVVHGHTADIREKTIAKKKLSSTIDEVRKGILEKSQNNIQDRITNMWVNISHLCDRRGSPELIAGCIAWIIHQVENSQIESDQSADQNLNRIFQEIKNIANKYPRSEPDFLNNYEGDPFPEPLASTVRNYKNDNKDDPRKMRMLYTTLMKDPQLKKQCQASFRDAQSKTQEKLKNSLKELAGALGQKPEDWVFLDSSFFIEALHTLGNKLPNYIKSFSEQKKTTGAKDPLEELLTSEQENIWITQADETAAEAYISLDAGVGASEDDSGGETRIFLC